MAIRSRKGVLPGTQPRWRLTSDLVPPGLWEITSVAEKPPALLEQPELVESRVGPEEGAWSRLWGRLGPEGTMAGKRLRGLAWPPSFAESRMTACGRWDSSKRPVPVPGTRVTLHTYPGVREQGKCVGGGPR